MGRHKKEILKTDDERCPVSKERMELIKLVYNDMQDAAPYSVLAEKLRKDSYGIGKKFGTTECYNIIHQARKLIQSDFKEYCKDAREEIWSSVMDLATESKTVGDRGTALKCFQYIGKLLGLEEPTKLEINSNEKIQIEFT